MKSDRNLYHTLLLRLKELSAYALVHHRSLEPHRYPKGLFKAQNAPKRRYQIDAYLNEIKENLGDLQHSQSSERQSEIAKKILQQITVLTVSLKSQKMRPYKVSSLGGLLNDIHQTDLNAFDYFCQKEKESVKESIVFNRNKNKSKLDQINLLLNKKQQLITETHNDSTRLSLQREYDLLKEEQNCLCIELEKADNRLKDL